MPAISPLSPVRFGAAYEFFLRDKATGRTEPHPCLYPTFAETQFAVRQGDNRAATVNSSDKTLTLTEDEARIFRQQYLVTAPTIDTAPFTDAFLRDNAVKITPIIQEVDDFDAAVAQGKAIDEQMFATYDEATGLSDHLDELVRQNGGNPFSRLWTQG